MIELPGWDDPDRRDDALERVAARVSVHRPRRSLAPPELNVLRCLSSGLTHSETGEVLHISFHTVKDYTRTARQLLAAKTTTQACCEAIRQGLIP